MSRTSAPWLVQIWRRNLYNDGPEFAGNGILVNPYAVLTCRHLITTDEKPESPPLPPEDIETAIEGKQDRLRVISIASSNEDDLALLRLDRAVAGSLPRFCSDLQITDRLGVQAWQKRGCAVERQVGHVVQWSEVVRERIWYLEHGMPKGFSGSPLLFDPDRRALVVGLVDMGSKGSAKSTVIPTVPVCEFLEKQGLTVKKVAPWHWLRNVVVAVLVSLLALSVVLANVLGKTTFILVAFGLLTALTIVLSRMVAGIRAGSHRREHSLYFFFQWLDQMRGTLVPIAAVCLFIQPELLGWKAFIEDPPGVTHTTYAGIKDTSRRILRIAPTVRPTIPNENITSTITFPTSTELAVKLTRSIFAANISANASYSGSLASDVVVPGSNTAAVLPRSTPVLLQVVPNDDTAFGLRLVQISVNGQSYSSSTGLGSRSTGVLLQLSRAPNVRHVAIGGGIGAAIGGLFGHKGSKREDAMRGAATGAKLGRLASQNGSKGQVASTVAPSEVIVFHLTQPLIIYR